MENLKSIEEKMSYFNATFQEYGYNKQQIELFKQYVLRVWPDGELPRENVEVYPLYYELHDGHGGKVRAICPPWTTEEEWWAENRIES